MELVVNEYTDNNIWFCGKQDFVCVCVCACVFVCVFLFFLFIIIIFFLRLWKELETLQSKM